MKTCPPTNISKKSRTESEVVLVSTINTLIAKSNINQITLAKIARIPYTTLNDIMSGDTKDPRLSTLVEIAKVFNITLSKLIGEIPLSFPEKIVPILKLDDIDVKNAIVNFNIMSDTQYTSSSYDTMNKLFALHVGPNISSRYKDNTVIILEEIEKFDNNDLVLLSINNMNPSLKKARKDGGEVYLDSLSKNLPVQPYNKENVKIFGVVRETRILH